MKNVVWVSPFQDSVVSGVNGQVFTFGKSEPVTDELAEKLLTNPGFKLADDPEAVKAIAERAAEAAPAPVAPADGGVGQTNDDPFKHA